MSHRTLLTCAPPLSAPTPKRGRLRSNLLCAWLVGGFVAIVAGSTLVQAEPPVGGHVELAAVFGADDRVPLPGRYASLQESLGVFFNPTTRSICSGFCVADNVVATASHCLYRTAGEKPPRLADFWFARNYDTLRDYARIAGFNTGAAAQNVIAGSARLRISPPIDATSDWALVRLSRPICAKRAITVSDLSVPDVIRQSKANRTFQIAYHRDYTLWRPAYSKPCRFARDFDNADWRTIAADFSAPDRLLLHTCDTAAGSSGSPLLIETPQGIAVVGINVGTYMQSRIAPQSGIPADRSKADVVANTGVVASSFSQRIAPFSKAVILGTAAQIRELQEGLQQRGHYSGVIDGTFGAELRKAIEDYEQASGLAVTGIASEALLQALVQPTARAQPPRRPRR